jgi:hypothetical protein
MLDTGGLRRTAAIDANGQAFFPEIPASFRGQEASVGLDANGYELVYPNRKIRLDHGSAYIEVQRKAGRIAGHVENQAGEPLADVTIFAAGITAFTKTDGSFVIAVPGEMLQPEFRLQARAEGYKTWSDSVVPNSNEISITLEKK